MSPPALLDIRQRRLHRAVLLGNDFRCDPQYALWLMLRVPSSALLCVVMKRRRLFLCVQWRRLDRLTGLYVFAPKISQSTSRGGWCFKLLAEHAEYIFCAPLCDMPETSDKSYNEFAK